MNFFHQKNIVITGASSGLGRSAAIYFSKQDARLILLARREEQLKETLSLLKNPSSHLIFKMDLCQAEEILKAASLMAEHFPAIDILINNAGNWAAGSLDSVSDRHVEQMVTTSLTGSLLITKHLLPLLHQAKDAQILNVVSTAGLTTNPINFTSGSIAYHAAKWGQAGFSEALRDELKNKIRVTSLYPGSFDQKSSLDDGPDSPHVKKGMLGIKDVVEAMVFCLTRPPYVSIDSLVIAPKAR